MNLPCGNWISDQAHKRFQNTYQVPLQKCGSAQER